MSTAKSASNIDAPTQFIEANGGTYAYRRFGAGAAPPLLLLQHFTGTLDNWDPAVTDPLASGREVILFESAGVGRSTGRVHRRLPAWPPTPWLFLMPWTLSAVTFSDSRSAAWSHSRSHTSPLPSFEE